MDILGKNLAAFFPCHKIMPETKLNSNGLIFLVKEV